MFLNIELDNFQGIENKIKLNFLAPPKTRSDSSSIYLTHDGVKIYKVVGIIGENASGKTSVMNALCAIDTYIKEKDEISKKMELLKAQNNDKEKTKIAVELYIEKEKRGYYRYTLEYTKNYGMEKLEYKKRYRDDWNEFLDLGKNKKFVSNIYAITQSREYIKEFESSKYKVLNELTLICETFYKHYVENSFCYTAQNANFQEEIIKQYFLIKEEKAELTDVIKNIDKTIKSIIVDTDKKEIIFENFKGKKLKYDELSDGTRKFLQLSVIIKLCVNRKGIFLCDEIENFLYSDLVEKLINIFNDNEFSQMLFTTNNKNILDSNALSNNQIYIIERNEDRIDLRQSNYRYDKKFSINFAKEREENFNDLYILIKEYMNEKIHNEED